MLETTLDLSGGWTGVTNTIRTVNGADYVTLNFSGNGQFYRLHKQ
jgi:hypothetical protein